MLIEDRDALCQELSELYALRACLAELEKAIKKLKISLAEQTDLAEFNGHAMDECWQRLTNFVKHRLDGGA